MGKNYGGPGKCEVGAEGESVGNELRGHDRSLQYISSGYEKQDEQDEVFEN